MHSTIWPTAPGAIIGYRKNGTPIRPIADGPGGGSGEGQDGGTGSGATAGGTSNDGSGGGGQQPANGATSSDGTGGGGGAGASDQTAKVIEVIRGDYKQERSRRQQLEKDLAALRASQEQATKDTEARGRSSPPTAPPSG